MASIDHTQLLELEWDFPHHDPGLSVCSRGADRVTYCGDGPSTHIKGKRA